MASGATTRPSRERMLSLGMHSTAMGPSGGNNRDPALRRDRLSERCRRPWASRPLKSPQAPPMTPPASSCTMAFSLKG